MIPGVKVETDRPKFGLARAKSWMLEGSSIRRRGGGGPLRNYGCRSPGTKGVQNTRLHQTADCPPWTSATTRPYLSLHRLSGSSARVPILETPRNACARLETRRLRRGANTRGNRFAPPRGSSPSLSDSSEVLRSTVRFPPRPPRRREGSIARNHVIQCDGDLRRPRESRVDAALHVPL